MAELHRMVKGRIAELQTAGKLLVRGHNVYAPLVDHHGIDFLIRRPDGSVDEIQVKSVGNGCWFQVQHKDEPTAAARPRHWILCVEPNGTTWVFPAAVFFDRAISTVSQGSSGVYTYDLNLDVKKRGNTKTNKELLAEYRDAWHLLD